MKYSDVVAAWNNQADESNQWETLSEDEKIEYTIEACAKIVDPKITALQTALQNMLDDYEHVCKLGFAEPNGSWAYCQAKNMLANKETPDPNDNLPHPVVIEPLGHDFAQVLHENLGSLYESD